MPFKKKDTLAPSNTTATGVQLPARALPALELHQLPLRNRLIEALPARLRQPQACWCHRLKSRRLLEFNDVPMVWRLAQHTLGPTASREPRIRPSPPGPPPSRRA